MKGDVLGSRVDFPKCIDKPGGGGRLYKTQKACLLWKHLRADFQKVEEGH